VLNPPNPARITAHRIRAKMRRMCLNLHKSARNGTKAHPPKTVFSAQKSTPQTLPQSHSIRPVELRKPCYQPPNAVFTITIHHSVPICTRITETRPIPPSRCKILREKPCKRHKVARFGTNLFKCAGFCLKVRANAKNCKNGHKMIPRHHPPFEKGRNAKLSTIRRSNNITDRNEIGKNRNESPKSAMPRAACGYGQR